MTLGVRVGPAEHGCGGARAEGERGELAHEVVAVGLGAEEALDGVDLDLVRVLAGDDHGVVDLAGLDHRGRERHPVDEAEAGVRDVEVDRRAGQPEPVVQRDGDRRLEVRARHRRVDEQADLRRVDAGLGQRALPGRDGGLVGRLSGTPVASLEHAGDAFEEAAAQLEACQGGAEATLDVLRGGHPTGQDARHRQQRDVLETGNSITGQTILHRRSNFFPPQDVLPHFGCEDAGLAHRRRVRQVSDQPARPPEGCQTCRVVERCERSRWAVMCSSNSSRHVSLTTIP